MDLSKSQLESKAQDMTPAEIIEDIAVSLAEAIGDDDDPKQIRDLLIEFAEEIKRQAIEP